MSNTIRCKAEIQYIDADWTRVKNECRTTVNKEATDYVPGHSFRLKLLISEHSPIRLIRVQWRWASIKSWIATHFARHWLGWDKWIGTRRSDRTGVNRSNLSQDELVPMDVCANSQALINVSRFRLCHQAADETREHMEDVKAAIHDSGEEELAFVMVPNCIYRGGCPEFEQCGVWKVIRKLNPDMDCGDIMSRYDAYNDYFWSKRKGEDDGQISIAGW